MLISVPNTRHVLLLDSMLSNKWMFLGEDFPWDQLGGALRVLERGSAPQEAPMVSNLEQGGDVPAEQGVGADGGHADVAMEAEQHVAQQARVRNGA